MSDSINIGLIQREIIPNDPAGNLLATVEMMTACSDQEVDLFVLSEYWATGLINPVESETPDLIQDIDGPTVESLRDFCRESGSWICAGSLAIRRKNGLTNTSLIIDPNGKIALEYDKTHLFSSMGEDRIFIEGDKLRACEVNGIGVGVLICYDLRFPSLTRRLANAGCEIILVPALWPEARIDHWETLLRARAIENQVYVVGTNGLLSQNSLFFPGHSMIVGPSGDALNQAEMRQSVIVRKLDLKQLRNIRRTMCFLDDEREINEVSWHSD